MNSKTRLEEYANESTFVKLNEHVADNICRMLDVNIKKYGEPYCPCSVERTPANICPCSKHLQDVKDFGKCCCSLFISK
jgi:ferredoxin-thioredoxin reductase catalytic subunit